ncbi:MAG: hypothetical protein Q7J73_03335 [Dehalococcoidales bacterium]|nr:hypothetical protein [Dehalococcoidales bacterium]
MVAETNKNNSGQSEKRDTRKLGFYSKVLDEVEQADFEEAREVDGIDEEIALLRVKIKSMVEYDPQNIHLIMQAIDSIRKLVRTKFSIGKNDKKGLLDAVGHVLRDIALPAGVTIGNIIKKG